MVADLPLYWHGSPYKRRAADPLLPGSELHNKVDRFFMNRNETVFVADNVGTADTYGRLTTADNVKNWSGTEDHSRFLYIVEPVGLFARDDRAKGVHPHIVAGERQCEQAVIVDRFLCEDPTAMHGMYRRIATKKKFTIDDLDNLYDELLIKHTDMPRKNGTPPEGAS